MTPKTTDTPITEDLFRHQLINLIDTEHELCQLANHLDWKRFEGAFGGLYSANRGRPGIPIRLMVGLHYLKEVYGLSDEAVVARWVENPYWQYFCGEHYFQHQLPMDASSLTRFRQKIGEAGCELMLSATVSVGVATETVKRRSLERVTVDTTVQEKAVSFPTDSKLYNRSRERLVKLARQHGVVLRQNYNRKAPQALHQASRYGQARQMKRMNKQVKKLKTYLGRVVRDIRRQLAQREAIQSVFAAELEKAERLFHQQRTDQHKLYSVHAPEVECIAKGKAHQRYEFGVKVSIAVTNRDNFVVGAKAYPGNPYDGHTLASALEQVQRVTHTKPIRCYVDRGYRGHGVAEVAVYLSGQKRGINTRTLQRELKRRQAVEPVIGHLKSDGLLGRNYLLGTVGDKMNAILCGAGHNLRLILRKLRLLWPYLFRLLFQSHTRNLTLGIVVR